jgi:hypothetical protein
LANDKYCNSRSGLAPYSLMIMPDTQKKSPQVACEDFTL